MRDTEADGRHVAVRLMSQESDGDIVMWRWHHYYGGSGDGNEWRTYASSSEGIRRVKVQAAVFEGDTQIRQCQSGWDA
ncbi:hypothetical protein QF037_006092 [Streptomyces canus]|nr:hypothetical protein [Streptomyces canus]